MKVTKDTLIGELINYDQENGTYLTSILMGAGMHCIGCHVAPTESLEEASMVHGIDPTSLVDALNEYLVKLDESKQ